MILFNLNKIFYYFLLIFFFFSLVGIGQIINNKLIKIKNVNFFENFIIGIFFIIFYLQIHIIFFSINFFNSLLIISFLFIGFYFASKLLLQIFSYKLIISLILCYLVVLNSSVFPYYNVIFDFGLYHNTYLNWLNQSNIVLGLANLDNRFGYAGSSYLLGAFFNFYPFFNKGFVFTTSIFYVFLIFLLIHDIDLKKNKFDNLFNLLILYVVLKYIFVETLSDVSPSKIIGCLIIYIFYNLIKNYEYELKNNFVYSLLILPILVSLSPSSWLISIFLFIIIFFSEKFKNIYNYKIVFSFCLLLCFNYGLINFLKTGNIFYPVIFPIFDTSFTIYDNNILYHIQNFPKGYPVGLEWILPKLKEVFFLNNFALLFLLLIISLFIFLITGYRNLFFKNKILVKLCLVTLLSIFCWFILAPDIRFGKIYFWVGSILILSFYLSKILKDKYVIYLAIIIYSYCIISSINNLAYNRNKIDRENAVNQFNIKQVYKISETYTVKVKYLNYNFEKFVVHELPRKIDKMVYEKKYFSKIYFAK